MKLGKLILNVLMLCCLIACRGNTTTSTSADNQSQTSQVEESVKSALDEMCDYLEKKGVVLGEKSTKNGAMVGAVEGIGYSESGAEIYIYSSNAPSSFEIFGIKMDFDATNGIFALTFSSGKEKKQDIIEVFKKAKTN